MGKGLKWTRRLDEERQRSALRCERARKSVPPEAAEAGERRRFMCWVCEKRWRSTVRAVECPFCGKDAVEERI